MHIDTFSLLFFFLSFATFALKAGACRSAVGGLRQSNHVYSTWFHHITKRERSGPTAAIEDLFRTRTRKDIERVILQRRAGAEAT